MKKLLLISCVLVLSACAQNENSAQEPTSTPEAAISKPIETNIQSGTLSGTFLDAGQNAPVVIIVPGSGPTDRDGNNAGFVSNAYKFLAEGLADAGISSVRVDKRGLFSSTGAGDPNKVSVEIYAEDYRNWVKTVTEKTGRACAFLLGHSEGGLMVSAAAIDTDNVCGVITVAAPGYRLSDVLRKQLKNNPANAPVLDDALKAIDSLEAGDNVDVTNMHPALLQLFTPAVQGFLISLFQHDPAEVLAQVDSPKLVVQGSHDIQVSVEDAKRLADRSGAKLVIADGISHVLKPAPADRMANIKTYNSPDTPVDSELIKAIRDFVESHS